MNLKQNLIITYSNQKARELKKTLKNPLDKVVTLSSFVNDLKKYYIDKYKKNKSVVEKISNIIVDGNDKYSMIKNIPLIEVNGRKMISIITEDLIKLLSK
jgi:hypothetical protein